MEETSKHYRIADLPLEDRPRERLLRHGPEALRTEELLAIILRTGAQGRSAVDLAREILRHFDNDLVRLSTADTEEFSQIKGIGSAKSAHLKAIFALAGRLAEERMRRVELSSPEAVAAYFRHKMLGLKQEQLYVLLLDTRNFVIRDVHVSTGLVDRSPAHAREVFRSAIQSSATKVVLVHNHPSGDHTPSNADLQATKAMVEAGKLLQIPVVDHIIMGRPSQEQSRDYTSLRESGFIS